MPSAREVWFFKTSLFGASIIHKVNVDDLEKVEKDDHFINSLLWYVTKYDKNMIFRDRASGELFVFDWKTGNWNEDTLKHPLIY